MESLTENNDKLEKLPLTAMNQTEEKPKWWECGGHVRGKKQSRDSSAAGERGRALTSGGRASGQDQRPGTEEDQTKSTSSSLPAGYRPGLMSDLGGVAGCWLNKPRQGAPVQAKL